MPNVDRDAPTVSAEERAELRELHVQCEAFSGLIVCDECLDDYPCPTIRTLDALEATERELTQLREQLRLANVDWALSEAERNNAEAELAHLRGVVRDAVAAMREQLTHPNPTIQRAGWYGIGKAVLGWPDGVPVPEDGDDDEMSETTWATHKAIRALVAAAAQEATDAE